MTRLVTFAVAFLTVLKAFSTPVASIGEQVFETLQEAVAAVPVDGTPTTVVLLKSADEALKVPEGVKLTLDLNGFNLTSPTAESAINNSGDLVVRGSGAITRKDGAGYVVDNGPNATLEIAGGDYSKTSGSSALVRNRGTLVISGGTVSSMNGTKNVNIYQETNLEHVPCSPRLTITGGLFLSTTTGFASNMDVHIQGGTFTSSSGVGNCLDSGYGLAKDSSGKYVVSDGYVAKNNGGTEFYRTLDEAIAKSTTAINLVADVTGDFVYPAEKTGTQLLYLNGHKLTGNIVNLSDKRLVVGESSIEKATSAGGLVTGTLTGNILVTGGKFAQDPVAAVDKYARKTALVDGVYIIVDKSTDEINAALSADGITVSTGSGSSIQYFDLIQAAWDASTSTTWTYATMLADSSEDIVRVKNSHFGLKLNGNAFTGSIDTDLGGTRKAVAIQTAGTAELTKVVCTSFTMDNDEKTIVKLKDADVAGELKVTKGSLTIEGGTYAGKISGSTVGKLIVKGGTFANDPTNYLADGYVAVQNDQGRFEVRDHVIVTVPDVEHATATVTVNGVAAEIVDGKVEVPVGAKVVVKYAPDDEWAGTKSVTLSNLTADTTVDVGTYKPAPAKVKVIAKDGTVSWSATLTTMNAKDGATYILLDDVTTSALTLGSLGYKNNSVTLDLNGHTLKTTSTSAGCKFNSNATGNTLTVKNGTFVSAAEGFAVNKTNTLILDETLTVRAAKSCATVIGNGATLETAANLTTTGDTFAIAGNGSAGNGGTAIRVTGGSVTSEGKAPAIYQPQAGTLEITGGTITGPVAVYVKSGDVSITGGTLVATGAKVDYGFSGNGTVVTGDALVIDNCNYPGGAPTAVVTGGRFESANGEPIASYAGAAAGETAPELLVGFVSGGDDEKTYPTFNKNLAEELCGPGFEPSDDGNGEYSITRLPAICEVEGVGYWSLSLAAEAAAKSGNPVVLIAEVNLKEQVLIEGDVTIDLAGHTISYVGETVLASGVLAVKRGGALTIEDSVGEGVIDAGTKAYAAVAMTVKGESAEGETASLTVNGGTLKGYYYGIVGNGSRHGTSITINDGLVTGTCPNDNMGIYHPQDGTLTINGGKVSGYDAGVEMRAGTFVMTGGELEATADHVATNPNGSGSTSTGAALAIAQHTTKKPISVSITDGTLHGFAAVYESNPNKTDATDQISISISGGTFVTTGGGTVPVYSEDCGQFISGGNFSNRVPDELCDEGFDATDVREDGMYGVTPKKTVAKIGSREFWSIDRAIAAASDDEVVELVEDYKGPGFTVGDEKDVVFSTAGYTYTATSPISVGGRLVIADESTIDFEPMNPEDTDLFVTGDAASKVDISAGSFNVPLKAEWCDDAYEPAELEDGRFGVQEKQHVCTINGKGYWSVEAALKAADPFDTIVMIEDVIGDAPAVTLEFGHVTLDLNGHVISSILVDGAVVTVQDSKRTGHIGGEDVETAITVAAGKLFVESGRVIAKDKAVSIEQNAQGELIAVEISGGTFTAPTAFNQTNVNGLPSSSLDQISINITDGVFTGNVYAEDKRAFITGGQFDPPPEKKYKRDDIKAELPSVTVTTELDVVNPYDFKISLREALLYAEQDAHNGISEEGGYKITFNWDAIKADAAARGVEATGVFDLSAAPFEATSDLYDETMGRCKFILIDGTLDAGEDGMMGEGDRMAVIRGLDFKTLDTTAPVRAVVVEKDPETVITLVDALTERNGARGDASEDEQGGAPEEPAPVVSIGDEDEIDESEEGVCELDGELYTSVRQALAAVPADGQLRTLKLLDDFTGLAITLKAGQNVVLDLDGHRYEVTNGGFAIQADARLVLKNGSIRSNTASTLLTTAGDLTLEDLDLDLSERPAVTSLVKVVAGSTLVTGSTSMTGRIVYEKADRVEFRGTGDYDVTFDAPLTANIRIYSGHFADPEAVPVEFQAVPLDGFYWQIVDAEGVQTKYATLHEAYATIPGDGTPVTITQLFDQTDRGLVIDGNKNVTIDFNGKTFTVEGGVNHNFIIDGKHEVVTLRNGTLRTTAPGNLISNKGHLTLADLNIDLRASALHPDFRNIISTTYGETVVTGDTRLAVPKGFGTLAVTAQRNDEWAYDKVQVTFDESFTGQVIGAIRYGESAGSTSDTSWLDAARIDVNGGEFDITLVDTTPLVKNAVENIRLHGGTFTKSSAVGTRPVGDFAYTVADIDWELRLKYVHFEKSGFSLCGRANRVLVDRCWLSGESLRHPDWMFELDSSRRTQMQVLNSVIRQAKGVIRVDRADGDAVSQSGYVLIADSTIGETTGDAAIAVDAAGVDAFFANATFYGNAGKVIETSGRTHAVNVLSQKNGENLPANIEVLTSIYQEEYSDEEIFRMDAEDPAKPHFGFRWLRAGAPVSETQEGAWSLTPAYHLNDESVAGGNCRYVKLAIDDDGYVEAIQTSLKPNGPYTIFAGDAESKATLHMLHYDQTIANLDRGQPSKGAFWIPVDEPSLVVTTIRDTVNPTDLEISLREAINYAKYLATEDTNTISTITFDWESLDEELAALRKNGIVGTAEGQLDDFALYLGWSIDWDRRSGTGDCHLVPGRSASKPISITAEELPQGIAINANRSGSVRPYFTVNGSLWESDVPVAFDLGDGAKLKTDHFRVTAVDGTAYQLGKVANLYLTNSSAADSCRDAIVGDEGSTVVLERTSVANNSRTGVTATNVSAQNATIDGPSGAVNAANVQLFNTTVVGGVAATKVAGVNDIVSGPVTGNAWFRYSAFDACSVDEATTNVTHNLSADSLALAKAQSSLLWYYRFEPALDWGRLGTAISTAKSYDWAKTGAAMPTYVWGQRTTTSDIYDVEVGGVQALPDTWAAYRVGEDEPYADELKGAILNDILTNTRNPHFEQLSMGAWQGRTIVAWKTLAKEISETDHATDFSRVDLNTYYATLQEAVEALTINKDSGDRNVQFEGKDAIFLVSATLTNTALGENGQTIIKDGDVAIVGNSYYWSGLKSTTADAAIIVSNDCSVAFSNVGLVDSIGDGVRVYGSGHVSFNRSAVNGNNGDGIRFMDGAHGDLLLVNTTVAKNKGTGVRMQSGMAQIYDSTIAGNATGLAGDGDFYIANSVILKNTTANEEQVNVVREAYNVMTRTGLDAAQEDAVFRDANLAFWYRMLRVNYTGAAGWTGTKLARDTNGNWFYLDRGDPLTDALPEGDWTWTPLRAGVTQKGALTVVTTDQQSTSRLLAENAGFHEYAVGAYVPAMELEVEVMDQFYQYNGRAQNPDPNRAIYRIRTGIGKLNQGHELYYNAADKTFYSTFAYVTNRVADALGVAPAPWGEPTVSNPRTDLGDFGFSADIVPIQAGDKINVLRRSVPGARVDGGFSVDADGYAYIDGYPFAVTDVVLTKGGRDLTESYTVCYPQTEARDYAMMYITPKSISLSRAFAPTKEYDGTSNVIITTESLEHAGVLFGEVIVSPGSKFEYNMADVLENYGENLIFNPDGTVTILANPNTTLKAEDLGFIGSPNVMGNYYITSESQNYTSVIVPKKIRVSLGEIAKKLYDGETTTITFDFADDRLIYTATNAAAVETTTLAEALVLPTRYIEGTLTVCQTNVIGGIVYTNATQVFAKDAADYPFFVICEDLHVYDTEDQKDERGDRKEFTRNYAFDFTACEGVYTVEKRPVTLPVSVDDRVYTGSRFVEPPTAVSSAPISTGVKDEAFSITSLGVENATYETAHVKGDEERQKISILNFGQVELTGGNDATTNNYLIALAPTGRILRRALSIEKIKGVETKLYDGSTLVRIDTADVSSYSYVAADETTGLVAGEFVKLTGEGRVVNAGVGATHQKVDWTHLAILDDTGTANDYVLQPFETDFEDVSVRIEPCDLQLAFSTQRVYDGTLGVYDLVITATKTNAAGKATALKVTPVAAAEGAAWSFRVQTGIVNERTEVEEIVYLDVVSAALTKGEVNTYAGDRRDVLVVSEVQLRAEDVTGAVLANYRAFAGERNVATERDLVGTARIDRRPITFQAANRTMVYGGKKPDLTVAGSYELLNEADLAAGDQISYVKLVFDTNNIRKSRSGEFQKGYYEKGIVRGDVSIVDGEGRSRNRNYTITVRPGSLQVGPGQLSLALDATPFVKDYDGTVEAAPNYDAITLVGLIENNLTHEFDDVTVTGVFTYDTKDVVLGDDGSYTNKTITFVRTAIGGKDAANYDWATDGEGNVIVRVSAFGATINPRKVTVNISAADKDYDSTTLATPTTVAFDNLVAEEAFDFDMTGVTAAFADKHKGVDKPVTVSLNSELLPRISSANAQSLTTNYAFAFDSNTSATIRGIPLMISAEAQAMIYGDANPTLVDQWRQDRSGEDSDLVPADKTSAGDKVVVELAYADSLAKSTSGNFTAKTHENAIALKACVVIDDRGEDVTDSYDITYESANLTVEPRTIGVSVEGEGVTKVYDGTVAIAAGQENHAIANNITAALAKDETADDVDVAGVFAYNTKDVATGTTIIFSNLVLTGVDASNYTLGEVTEVSDTGAKITPFETTVKIAANGKTYDGDTRATAKSAAFAPLVGDEQFALTIGAITGTFADRHAAVGKTVTWDAYSDDLVTPIDGTGAIKTNYAFIHDLGAMATIDPKPATISFAAKSKQYDATTVAERTETPFVFEGLVSPNEEGVAEAFTLVDTAMSYAFADKNVGEGKTVTASGYDVSFVKSASEGGESVPGDYKFEFKATAKADITKKPMTISYTTGDKVYDATAKATRKEFTYDGLCENDKVTLDDGAMTYIFMDVDGEGTGKNVGENKVVRTPDHDFEDNGKMTGTDAGNYSYTFNPESKATIVRRPVAITFARVEKTYDGTVDYVDEAGPRVLVPIVTNMAEGETLGVQATGAFVDKIHNAAADYFRVDAFSMRIADGQDLGNYTVTYAGDRQVELPAATLEYVMPNAAQESSFFTAGQINRKPMTVTADGQVMTYGEAIPEVNSAVYGGDHADWREEGSVRGDHVAVTLGYSASIPKSTSRNYKAGTHAGAIVKETVVVTDDGARDVTDSYEITYVAGQLVVNKRDLSMTLNGPDFTKVYDGNVAAKQSAHMLVNNVDGDVVDVKGSYVYNSKNVVEAQTVTANALSITGTDAANYRLTEASYTSTTGAKITERPTVITVKPENKVYDGTMATKAKIESFSNLVSGESFSLNKAKLVATFAQSDVGTAVEVTYVGYDPSQISAGANTRFDNYSFTFTNKAVGDITKRPSTITWLAEDKQYDAKVRAEVTPGSFVFGNLVDGEGFTMDEAGFTYAFADKNVGTAKPVTATPNGTLEAQISSNGDAAKVSNYAFTLTKTAPADITPAPLTITFTANDKTYDATPKATRDTFSYAPLLVDDTGKTDDVTLDDSKMEYAFVDVNDVENTGKNADANKIVKTVPGKGYDKSYLRGVDKDNYEVAFTDKSTATIFKKQVHLVLPKPTKVYDATTELVWAGERGAAATLTQSVAGAGLESFFAEAKGVYKDTHADDYDTYLTVTELTIEGQNGAVFGNYILTYAGHGGEAECAVSDDSLAFELKDFLTTNIFGTPAAITALGFTVAALDQSVVYGNAYPEINGDGNDWGRGTVWSLPSEQLATGDRIWVTLKWSESIPTSSAGFYTAGTHIGALAVKEIRILRQDNEDVTASYSPTFQVANLTVSPRVLTVTVDGANFKKVYDGNCTTEAEDRAYAVDEAVENAGTGKFAKDDVTVEGAYAYNDKDVEEANMVTFSEQTLMGSDAANYTLSGVTSVDSSKDATITRRPCDITVTTTGKTYDGYVRANKIGTYAFSNLVAKNESGVKEDFTLAVDDFAGVFNTKDVETATTVIFTHEGGINDHLVGKDATSLLSNYDFTFRPTAAAKIAPLTVRVTWEAEDKNYDQKTVAEPRLGSFVFTTPVVKNENGNAESFRVTDENAKAMTYAFDDKFVGKAKTVTATGWSRELVTEGADTLKSNYIFDFIPTASAEIKSIRLTIGFAANDKTYDAKTTATRKGDFTYDGLIDGDAFALNDAAMAYDFDTKDVGAEKTVTANGFDEKYLSGADVKNYDVHFTDTAKAAITRKNLTLTLSEAKKVYDGTTAYAESVGQVISGTEGGEVFTATGTGVFVSKLVGSAADYFEVTKLDVVGTSGADFGNYTIAYNGGTVEESSGTMAWAAPDVFRTSGTITPAEVVVTARNRAMTYGDADFPSLEQEVSCDVKGLLPTDALTASFSRKTFAAEDRSSSGNLKAGTYAEAILVGAVSIANDAEDATASYVIKTINGSLTVGKKPVTVELDGSVFSKTYDGTRETVQKDYRFASDDVVLGDTVTATGTFAYDDKDAGEEHVVTMSDILLGPDDDSVNYSLVNSNAKAESDAAAVIQKKVVTVSAKANDKTYDKSADATSQIVAFDGLVEGEALAYPTTLTGVFEDWNTGLHAVTWTDFDWEKVTDVAVRKNYTPDLQKSVATIAKKSLTITAPDRTMMFGAAMPDLSAGDWSQEGLVLPDALTAVLAWSEEVKSSRPGIGVHEGAIRVDILSIRDGSDDMSGNYAVTCVAGRLTVTKGANKALRIGWVNEHLPISVDPEWLDRNVAAFRNWAEDGGDAQTSDGLRDLGKNGYELWQSYILGLDPQDPMAKIWIDAEQTPDVDRMHVVCRSAAERPTTAYAVHFRLDAGLKGSSDLRSSHYQDGVAFDIALGGADPTGTYTIQCVFTSNTVSSADVKASDLILGEGVRSVNVFGLLKVEATTTNTIVAVPWTALTPRGDHDVAVANLLKTATLDVGDMIHVYSLVKGRYESYVLSAENVLEPVTLVAENGLTEHLPPATETFVSRGGGVMLSRKDPFRPIYLFGQVAVTVASTEIVQANGHLEPVHHLIGAPGVEDFDIQLVQAADGTAISPTTNAKTLHDQIFVPTDAAEPIMYTYKDGKWGYDARVATTVAGMTFYTTKRVTDLPKIKAGTGFWYVSRGGNPKIVWPKSEKGSRQ